MPLAEYRATIRISSLPPLAGTPLPFRQIAGYHGGAGFDTATLVVKDSASWSDTWRRLNSPTNDVPALPAVDFTREMIVFVVDYGVFITTATRDAGVVRVQLLERKPSIDCASAPVSEASDYVRLPRLNIPVVVSVAKQTQDCDD